MPPRSDVIINARIDTAPSLIPRSEGVVSWGSHTGSHPEERVGFAELRGIYGDFLTLLFAFSTV